ncbi:MAG: WD40/YVTN/BNR-like repeat-containing protein [Ktedonobacterales bacterium]
MVSSDEDSHAHQTPPSTLRPTATSDDDWTEDAIVSSLKSVASTRDQPAPATPLWSRRLSQRDKLLRVSVAALAMLLVLVVVIRSTPPARPSDSSAASLDSFRRVAALAAHPAVPLFASPWEQVALPPSHNAAWSFALAPSDPSTVFACAATNGTQDGPVELWRSRDAGAHWQRVAVSLTGSACLIQTVTATDGHIAALATGFSRKSAAQGNCSSIVNFISHDGGDTWAQVSAPGTLSSAQRGANCALIITSHHLYLWHFFSNGVNVATGQHTFLERSDDGATWIRADTGLSSDTYFYPTFLSGSADDSVIASVPDQHGAVLGVTLWRSQDGGGHWQRLGDTERYVTLFASQESPAHRSDLASHMLYGLARYSTLERSYALRMLQSSDGQHWSALPALPVDGAYPDHIGVLEELGVASGGKPLFLGADPHAGIPRTGSDPSTWRGDTQWLWAWDPHAQRWEVPQKPLQVPWPATCSQYCWQSNLSWGAGPDGSTYGTYVWVLRQGDTTMNRTFIPAS